MTHTSHGHWIAGTPHTPWTASVSRCGGPGVCTVCSREAAATPVSKTCLNHEPKQHRDGRPAWCKNCGLSGKMSVPYTRFEREKLDYLNSLKEEPMPEDQPVASNAGPAEDPQTKARRLVVEHENRRYVKPQGGALTIDEVVVVFYTYTLGYWKATLATTRADHMYYEVTYDRDRKVAFVDSYKKWENSEYPDDAPVHGNKEEGITPTPAGTGG